MNPQVNNMMGNMMNNMVGKVMQNNPVMAMLQAMRNGGNPMALMQNMAKSNPQMAQALNMIQGKDASQLETMAKNMCKERGVNPSDIAQQLGIPMPQQSK